MHEGNGKTFAKWALESQNFYIRASMAMTIVIASRTDDAALTLCLRDWYMPTPEVTAEKTEVLRQVILKNQDFLPSVVLMGAIEKKCGKFPVR